MTLKYIIVHEDRTTQIVDVVTQDDRQAMEDGLIDIIQVDFDSQTIGELSQNMEGDEPCHCWYKA